MNKKEVFPATLILDSIAEKLAALLKRLGKAWKGPQLQPIPVKAKN